MGKAGVYIHIPFCKSKCPYCAFFSKPGTSREQMLEYTDALCRDIKETTGSRSIEVDTVYFGGGTPTVMPDNALIRILNAVKDRFNVAENSEITVEANPGTVDSDRLIALRKSGFNRISFGVQSAQDSELRSLGRAHSFEKAREAILAAENAGFDNISCDLMIGTPYQTEKSLIQSVDALCSMPIVHISAYMLSIEKGTPFDCERIRSLSADSDMTAELYLSAVKRLEENGFEQYEISSFCKNGMRSRHNMKYWLRDDYYGLGASAHSFVGGVRYYYESDILSYIKDPKNCIRTEDNMPNELEEYTMLSLRTTDGLNVNRFAFLGGDSDRLAKLAAKLEKNDMGRLCNGVLRLTPKGFLVSNGIICSLLA